MTRYEAFIAKDWRDAGIGYVTVVRRRDIGTLDYGAFLVDFWCLGVKDAFGEADMPESDFTEYIADRLPEDVREPIHPACAKKLIEGAVAYAESIGFAPHRDFRKARRVLSGLDASFCPMVFTFGREGRPCYVRGADDSEERVERVLAILEARVGEDGFDYEDPAADEDDSLAMRENLIDWLDEEPPEVPRFYALSGMVTALHICPGVVGPSTLIGSLWPEGHVWEDPDDLQYFTELLTEYWNYVGELVTAATAPDAPPDEPIIDIWPEDFPEAEDDGLELAAASVEWARGFMETTARWPAAWGDALQHPKLAPHWEVMRWWAGFLEKENRDRISEAAEADESRTLANSVRVLAATLRREQNLF